MQESSFTIKSNGKIALNTFRMILEGDTSAIGGSGQFVQIELPGKFLRRPISVCDYDAGSLTLIYKVVGEGTALMSRMAEGETLTILTGLGHGFDADKCKGKALLVGGGVGTAPLYRLARELRSKGKEVTVILGFNCKDEVMLEEEFKSLGAEVTVTTADGSVGVKGFVTDPLGNVGGYDYLYTCGPKVMMKALCRKVTVPGELSMEERMGCGFGICYGCTCNTSSGTRRVCKDGPVFKKEEIIW